MGKRARWRLYDSPSPLQSLSEDVSNPLGWGVFLLPFLSLEAQPAGSEQFGQEDAIKVLRGLSCELE